MHAGAVVLEERLGHEGDGVAVLHSDILGDVLVEHDVIRHLGQGVETHAELALAAGGHLVMVLLDVEAGLHHLEGHLGADAVDLVGRRHREVAFLGAGPVAQVVALAVAGVPDAFLGVDLVVADVAVLFEAHAVEDEELQLRSPVAGVGDAGGLQVLLRLPGDITRIAGVIFAGDRVSHIADQAQGGGSRIGSMMAVSGSGNEQHVALVDGRKPLMDEPSKPLPFLEKRLR